MLRKKKDLKGFSIGAKDGDIGAASDFIFDDKNWTVRYLVADTNRWLAGRKVLIFPIVVDRPDWEGKRLPVLLTQEQVKDSPDICMDETLSAQDEIKYYDYYGWPYYWAGEDIWGPATLPQRRDIAESHQSPRSDAALSRPHAHGTAVATAQAADRRRGVGAQMRRRWLQDGLGRRHS